MGAKRIRKVKGGWDAAEAAAAVSEGFQKLSTQYKGVAEANPLNYVLLSTGGEIGADKNRGEERASTVAGAAEGPLRISGTT